MLKLHLGPYSHTTITSQGLTFWFSYCVHVVTHREHRLYVLSCLYMYVCTKSTVLIISLITAGKWVLPHFMEGLLQCLLFICRFLRHQSSIFELPSQSM